MLRLDAWSELGALLWRHRLRTALTGLSVAWGIFVLVILLAAGRGLQNSAENDFRDDATNSLWLRASETSLAFGGRGPGRRVQLNNGDIEALQRELPQIDRITGRYYLWGNFFVSRANKSARFDIRGCHPDHLHLERTQMLAGRFINAIDIEQRRKVAVIGPEVKKALFGEEPFLGEMINVRGVAYQVVGLYQDEGTQAELRKIYVPISTAQLVYHGADKVHHIMYTVGDATVAQSQQMATDTRQLIAERHSYSPDDRRALVVTNNLERFSKIQDIFRWIRAFVWLVSLGTLLSGVIGVSNVMLISVRERTLEFGIRKALGATPFGIVRMVIFESLVVTGFAGYLGLLAAVAAVEAVQRWLPDNPFVREPSVDFQAAWVALGVLVLSGIAAGLLPAARAARVKPVVAIRAGY